MKNTKNKKAPLFKTMADEKKFWDTHDVTDFVDTSKGIMGIAADRYLTKNRSVSIRLPETLLANLKMFAQARDVAYHALIKIWLAEKLTQEKLLQAQAR